MTKKIIVADDRKAWRELYSGGIRFAFPNCSVDEVETGSDLVERVLQGDYSLVISDNNMEGENDGLEALKKIRESGSEVPFYLVCAASSYVDQEARNHGANGFYNKSNFDLDKIIQDITPHLQ